MTWSTHSLRLLIGGALTVACLVATPGATSPAVAAPVTAGHELTVRLDPVGGSLREARVPVGAGRTDVRAAYSLVAVTWTRGVLNAEIRSHATGRWVPWRP
ncbi:MAG: hypothetical protein R2731_13165 [Nocardioides sp.]